MHERENLFDLGGLALPRLTSAGGDAVPGANRRASWELSVGQAAEHLVCADLLLKGYVAYRTDQGLPYDVVGESDDVLLRLQVKATLLAGHSPDQHARSSNDRERANKAIE